MCNFTATPKKTLSNIDSFLVMFLMLRVDHLCPVNLELVLSFY